MTNRKWLASHFSAPPSIITAGEGPKGKLPLTEEMLREWPSGDLFGLTQNAGMGWEPAKMLGPQFLILSTMGGMRAEDGTPVALGYHTGHWEVGLLVKAAAETFSALGGVPFAAHCSDPCDGRTQGTNGMFDSLPYRNDAAIVMRRLVRSLPRRKAVLGIATCDKGLPATMQALCAFADLPIAIVPGGVTLPPKVGEDAGKVQTIGARFTQGEINLETAQLEGCRACGSPGGGCQFLGTAATSQVVAEAMGLTLPHAALAPSGQPVWLDLARNTAEALSEAVEQKRALKDYLTNDSIHNAMVVHAACGGSTNLLLHVPAIAHAAGLQRPSREAWHAVNASTPRFVDVLPNGPVGHPTVRMFLAGGVPEVMWHLRELGLIRSQAKIMTGQTWDEVLDQWYVSDRRRAVRERLQIADGVDPEEVIMPPERARTRGLTSTVCFPTGNLCPQGSVIKATAIDPSVVDPDGVYRKTGAARVFTTEREAIAAIKGNHPKPIQSGDVIVLIGRGPLGCGMEETYQVTSALRYLPWGKQVALVTDARFSGVSTGACIGHVGSEALAGGPISKVRDGDRIQIIIDRVRLIGTVDMIGTMDQPLTPEEGQALLASRPTHPALNADLGLPDDTRLWAALQSLSGGAWGGCVYDVEEILKVIAAGRQALCRDACPSADE